jgi:hypothetical protein
MSPTDNAVILRPPQLFRIVTVTYDPGYSSNSPGVPVSVDRLPTNYEPILHTINHMSKANLDYLVVLMQDDRLHGW